MIDIKPFKGTRTFKEEAENLIALCICLYLFAPVYCVPQLPNNEYTDEDKLHEILDADNLYENCKISRQRV